MQSHLEKSSCLKCKAVESKSIKSNFEWLRTRRMCWMTFSRKTLVKMTAFLAKTKLEALHLEWVDCLEFRHVWRSFRRPKVEKDKLAIWECRHLRRSHPSFLQLLSRTKAIYFGQLGKILWVRLPSIHSCCQPWWQFMSWSSTLTLNEAEELQWLGILSKTPDIERQHDDDILNFQPFFYEIAFVNQSKMHWHDNFMYQKNSSFCLDHFDSHAWKLTGFLDDDVTIFFLDQKWRFFVSWTVIHSIPKWFQTAQFPTIVQCAK